MLFIAVINLSAQLCCNECVSALRLQGAWHALTAWEGVMVRLVAQLLTWAASSCGHCPEHRQQGWPRAAQLPAYTRPGSNWRPSACEADVIATRPRVLVTICQSTLIQTRNTFLPLGGHVSMFLGFSPSFFFARRGLCGPKGPRQRP